MGWIPFCLFTISIYSVSWIIKGQILQSPVWVYLFFELDSWKGRIIVIYVEWFVRSCCKTRWRLIKKKCLPDTIWRAELEWLASVGQSSSSICRLRSSFFQLLSCLVFQHLSRSGPCSFPHTLDLNEKTVSLWYLKSLTNIGLNFKLALLHNLSW